MTRQYRAEAGRSRNAAERTAGFPGLPRVDLVPAVERCFDLVQRTVDINRRLAVRCAEVVGTLSGVVRDKTESAGDLVRDKAEAAGTVMREQAEQAQQAALERVEKPGQAGQELARQARQAEREPARRAHKRARRAPASAPRARGL